MNSIEADLHRDECEAEYIPEVNAWTPCTCPGKLLEHDLRIVAEHLVAQALESQLVHGNGMWDCYPEIGENDFIKIEQKALAAHPYPDHAAYLAAYARLEARAEAFDGQ